MWNRSLESIQMRTEPRSILQCVLEGGDKLIYLEVGILPDCSREQSRESNTFWKSVLIAHRVGITQYMDEDYVGRTETMVVGSIPLVVGGNSIMTDLWSACLVCSVT